MKHFCSDCYHSNICGSASVYNDASQCKQFAHHDQVLAGDAYKIIVADHQLLKDTTRDLETKLKSAERQIKELEHELALLRVIKQTLEMSSGMTFDI